MSHYVISWRAGVSPVAAVFLVYKIDMAGYDHTCQKLIHIHELISSVHLLNLGYGTSLTRAPPSIEKKKNRNTCGLLRLRSLGEDQGKHDEHLHGYRHLQSTEDCCLKVQEAVCSCMISQESSEEACIWACNCIHLES